MLLCASSARLAPTHGTFSLSHQLCGLNASSLQVLGMLFGSCAPPGICRASAGSFSLAVGKVMELFSCPAVSCKCHEYRAALYRDCICKTTSQCLFVAASGFLDLPLGKKPSTQPLHQKDPGGTPPSIQRHHRSSRKAPASVGMAWFCDRRSQFSAPISKQAVKGSSDPRAVSGMLWD